MSTGDDHRGPRHDHEAQGAPAHAHADDERRILWAMVLTGAFMAIEIAGGLVAGSLALLADAAHMAADVASLALAFAAFRVARRGHDSRRTYGYHRFQVFAAFINGITLVVIVAWIAVEAVSRLLAPIEVLGRLMLAVAAAGLVVNIASFAILHGGNRANINMRGAALHVFGDMLGSIAAIVAAIVIASTGWMPIDPLLSLAVAGLILHSAWGLLRTSSHILLEGAPDWLDVGALRAEMMVAVPGITDVHHVHTWMITAERPMMTLHVEVEPSTNHQTALTAVRAYIRDHVGIDHATIQIETTGCVDAERSGSAAGEAHDGAHASRSAAS